MIIPTSQMAKLRLREKLLDIPQLRSSRVSIWTHAHATFHHTAPDLVAFGDNGPLLFFRAFLQAIRVPALPASIPALVTQSC